MGIVSPGRYFKSKARKKRNTCTDIHTLIHVHTHTQTLTLTYTNTRKARQEKKAC